MPSVNTILTSYDKREGNGARGPWTLHLYKDAAGTSYQTFEAPISNRAYGLLNKPVVLTYEEKPSKNPQYPANKSITGIEPNTSVAAVSAAPVASQGTPSAVPTIPANPTASSGDGINKHGSPYGPVGSGADDRQVQIMRQSALERAIRLYAVEGPIAGGAGFPLYETSEEFLHYFQTGDYPGKSETEFLAAVGNEFPDAA